MIVRWTPWTFIPPSGDMADAKHVAVIGAGVAGLQAGSSFLQAGWKVSFYEKSANVGGVWQKNYDGYKLQVTVGEEF